MVTGMKTKNRHITLEMYHTIEKNTSEFSAKQNYSAARLADSARFGIIQRIDSQIQREPE